MAFSEIQSGIYDMENAFELQRQRMRYTQSDHFSSTPSCPTVCSALQYQEGSGRDMRGKAIRDKVTLKIEEKYRQTQKETEREEYERKNHLELDARTAR